METPLYTLPGGGRGAGGMAIFWLQSSDADRRTRGVAWSAWIGQVRKARISLLSLTFNDWEPLRPS